MFRKISRKKRKGLIAEHMTTAKVLDIGCGAGPYKEFFPNRFTLDIDPEKNPDVVGDIHTIPLEDNSYECILCTEVLEHVRDPKLAVSELYRVLKPGGKIIVSTPFVYPLHQVPHDYWRFTKYGLRNLFQEFKDVEVTSEHQSFTTIAILLQRIVFQSNLRLNKITKFSLLLIAWVFERSNWLIVEEFGSIRKDRPEDHIMTGGYFLVAKK